MRKISRIWKMLQRQRERVMHLTISGGALTAFEKLADDMDANPETVFICALSILKFLINHAQEGGEFTVQNGNEEFDLAFSYENTHGQTVTLPSQDDDSGDKKPSKTLLLSDNDKRFLNDLGIDLN